jgi:hypothetical protein
MISRCALKGGSPVNRNGKYKIKLYPPCELMCGDGCAFPDVWKRRVEMSEDRALIVLTAKGNTRWVIQRADGTMQWLMPEPEPSLSPENMELREEWKRLWNEGR